MPPFATPFTASSLTAVANEAHLCNTVLADEGHVHCDGHVASHSGRISVWRRVAFYPDSTLSSRLEAKTYDTSHCEMIETSVTLEFAFVHMIVEYDSRWNTCAACRVRVCRNTDITVGVRINEVRKVITYTVNVMAVGWCWVGVLVWRGVLCFWIWCGW